MKETTGIAFSPDGLTAALTEPGHVRCWGVGSGLQIRDLSQADIGSCRFSPDGRMLAIFDSTQSGIHILEAATGGERLRLAGHTEGTSCALFTPDGRKLITGGMDSTVLLWVLAPARLDTEKLDRLCVRIGRRRRFSGLRSPLGLVRVAGGGRFLEGAAPETGRRGARK